LFFCASPRRGRAAAWVQQRSRVIQRFCTSQRRRKPRRRRRARQDLEQEGVHRVRHASSSMQMPACTRRSQPSSARALLEQGLAPRKLEQRHKSRGVATLLARLAPQSIDEEGAPPQSEGAGARQSCDGAGRGRPGPTPLRPGTGCSRLRNRSPRRPRRRPRPSFWRGGRRAGSCAQSCRRRRTPSRSQTP